MRDFDATSFYLSAIWDKSSVFPKIKTGFAFKPHMNDVYLETFNNQSFNKDSNEAAILKIKFSNPPNLLFQHLLVKEKIKKGEVHRKVIGYIIDALTSVDIQEGDKIRGKVIQIYEGIIYRENFKISSFRKFF